MPSPLSLCILRLSAIGDVCHAAAMVRAIQLHHENIEITWVIGKIEYQLLKGMSGVRFIVYDKQNSKQAKAQLKSELGGQIFDVLFVMQVALRANLLSLSIKAKRRIGFDWARSKEGHYLFTNERVQPREHSHVLDGFMDFAACLGVEAEQRPLQWTIPIPKDDETWVDSQLDGLAPFAVISPAASKAQRNWTSTGYAKTAEYMQQQGLKVVLCGGPGALDATTRDAIVSMTDAVDLDLVGKTSLKQMLLILRRARLVIAPDTGPAHMATTQGTPVIGLYAHSNPKRTGPYMSLAHTVSVYDECVLEQFGKPWQALPWGKRAKGDDLMTKIKFEDVRSMIDKVITEVH
ncbi:glycosyltransferase family 9 protein [Ningiella sp. W23]|uniref:glycosyltransferase family 9 protein n=1 Tax=Ningiella sp. W23 TaxID=3023715 RepID=UPI003756D24C